MENFNHNLVERNLRYYVDVYPPESVKNNENVTLHFQVEKKLISITGMSSGSKDKVRLNGVWINADDTTVYKNFTPPIPGNVDSRYKSLSRNIFILFSIESSFGKRCNH